MRISETDQIRKKQATAASGPKGQFCLSGGRRIRKVSRGVLSFLLSASMALNLILIPVYAEQGDSVIENVTGIETGSETGSETAQEGISLEVGSGKANDESGSSGSSIEIAAGLDAENSQGSAVQSGDNNLGSTENEISADDLSEEGTSLQADTEESQQANAEENQQANAKESQQVNTEEGQQLNTEENQQANTEESRQVNTEKSRQANTEESQQANTAEGQNTEIVEEQSAGKQKETALKNNDEIPVATPSNMMKTSLRNVGASDSWLRLETVWYPYPRDYSIAGAGEYIYTDLLADNEPAEIAIAENAPADAVNGEVSYDPETNTLYLYDLTVNHEYVPDTDNLSLVSKQYVQLNLDMNNMGDLKLVVVGECALDKIQCFDGQLTIDGADWDDGAILKVRPYGSADYSGNVVYVEGRSGKLTIGDHIFFSAVGACTEDGGWGSGPVNVNGTALTEGLVINGHLDEGQIVYREVDSDTYRFAVSSSTSFDDRMWYVVVSPLDSPEGAKVYLNRKVTVTVPETLKTLLDEYEGSYYLEAIPSAAGGAQAVETDEEKIRANTSVFASGYYSGIPESLSFYTISMGKTEWGRLSLTTDVGDSRVELAYYDASASPITAAFITSDDTEYALTAADNNYKLISGVELRDTDSAVISPSDYSYSLYKGDAKVTLPALIDTSDTALAEYSIRVNSKNDWGNTYFRYIWSNQDINAASITGTDGSGNLIAVIKKRPDKVRISGHVYYGDDSTENDFPIAGAEVTIHQSLEGRNADAGETVGRDYNVTVRTDAEGKYEASVWLGVDSNTTVDFRVKVNGSEFMLVDSGFNEDITGDTVKDLHVSTRTFSVRLILTGMDNSITEQTMFRYLSALKYGNSWEVYQQKKYYKYDGTENTLWHNHNRAMEFGLNAMTLWRNKGETVSVYAGGPILADSGPENAIQIAPEQLSATVEGTMKGGILMNLGLEAGEATSSYSILWYDGDGVYAGKKYIGALTETRCDYALSRPNELTQGVYTGVLIPTNLAYASTGSSLEEIDSSLIRISADLSDGCISDLGNFTLSGDYYNNVVYATQPNSSLQADRESFSSEEEMIVFSGHIGLDSNYTSGKLKNLVFYLEPSRTSSQPATVNFDGIYINGQKYPVTQTGHTLWNDIHIEGIDSLTLPLDFTLYGQPVNTAQDVYIKACADVEANGNTLSGQYIGEATVSSPGTAISTLCSWVDDPEITIRGGALKNETVIIYDSGIEIGTAVADKYGCWTADVTLAFSFDDSLSRHWIYACGAESGKRTAELEIFHHPEAPQVKKFLMHSFGNQDGIPVGEVYTWVHWMKDVRFTADISHPENLADQLDPEASTPVKVAFKVWTMDGQVRLIDAIEKSSNGDGTKTFESKTVFTTYTPVTRAEVVYHTKSLSGNDSSPLDITMTEPTVVSEYLDKLTGADVDTVRQYLASIGEVNISRSALKSGNQAYLDYITGRYGADSDNAKAAKSFKNAFDENGFDLISFRISQAGDNTPSWLESLEAGDHIRIYDRNRFFDSAEALHADMDLFQAGAVLTGTTPGGAKSYTIALTDGNDTDGSGSFSATVSYYEDNSNGLYTVTAQAVILPGYQGTGNGAVLLAAAQAGRNVMLTDYNMNTVDTGSEFLRTEGGTVGEWETTSGNVAASTANIGPIFDGLERAARNANLPELDFGIGKFMTWMNVGATAANMGTGYWNSIKRTQEYDRLLNNANNLRYSKCLGKVINYYKNNVDPKIGAFPHSDIDAKWYNFKNRLENCRSHKKWLVGFGQSMNIGGLATLRFGVPGALAGATFASLGSINSTFCGQYLYKYEMEMLDKYYDYMNSVRILLRRYAQKHNDPDCNGKDIKYEYERTAGGNTPSKIDPSGFVYEAVTENRVKGAVVSIYEGGTAESNLAAGFGSLMSPAEPVQTTGSDGRYSWMVPAGNWFVRAQLGSLSGDSSADKEAVGGMLPVPPPQMNVNIPIVDNVLRPAVQEAICTTEGVYLIFTKYMDEDDLTNLANYELRHGTDGTGTLIPVTEAVLLQQGHAAPNRTDNTKDTYSKAVLLKTAGLSKGETITLKVDPDGDGDGVNDVRSYAGLAVLSLTVNSTVSEPESCADPSFSPSSAAIDYGEAVTISAGSPEDARIWYLICPDNETAETEKAAAEAAAEDGTGPSGWTEYSGEFPLYNDGFILAIAARTGYANSEIAVKEYHLSKKEGQENPSDPENPSDQENQESPSAPSGGETPGRLTPGYHYDTGGESESGRGGSTNANGPSESKGTWKKNADGSWSFLLSSGELAPGWHYIRSSTGMHWYRFNEKGIMLTGWQLDPDGRWYYLSEKEGAELGEMVTGWRQDAQDGYWYYLDPLTGAMRIGWVKIGTRWYYFNPEVPVSTWEQDSEGRWVYRGLEAYRPYGSMYRNEMTPDGYRVDENGVWKE